MDHPGLDRGTADRRTFLKHGALAAAPLAAAAVPAAALAEDGSGARLVRLQDERELETLHRHFVQHLSGQGDCSAAIAAADALDLGSGLRRISEHSGHLPAIELAPEGRLALTRCACEVEREAEFAGDTTLEKMARFQGQGSHRQHTREVLTTEFAKGAQGWQIIRASLA